MTTPTFAQEPVAAPSAPLPSPNLQIITTLEYLGKYGEGDPFWGVTISVGVAQDSGAMADLNFAKSVLRPWLWSSVQLNLYAVDKSITPVQLSHPLVQTPLVISRDTSPLTANDNGSLEVVFKKAVIASPDLLGRAFRLRVAANPSPADNAVNPGEEQPPWPAVLAQIGQLPYPIPHALNTCFLVRFPKPEALSSALETYFVVIPSFSAAGQTLTPGKSGNQMAENVALAVDYASTGTGVGVSCICNLLVRPTIDPSVRKNLEPSDVVCLDANDPYAPVRGGTAYDFDWVAEFPLRLAEAFDCGQRIIDATSDLLRTPSAKVPYEDLRKVVPQLRSALVRSLYELANTGIYIAPNGGSVLKSVLQGDVSLAEKWASQGLCDYQSTLDETAIRNLLRGTIAETAGCLALATPALPAPEVPLSPGESTPNKVNPEDLRTVLAKEVQQWEVLQASLTRDENLASLLLAQWKQAPPTPLTSEQHEHFLLLAQRNLVNLPLRRQYALGNLGTNGYWRKVTSVSKGTKDERGELKKNFVSTLHEAVEQQLKNVDGPVKTALLAKIDKWAELYVQDHLLPDHEVAPKPKTNPPSIPTGAPNPSVPHGVSIQADCLYSFDKDTAEQQEDIARQTSGFAIFMSELKNGSPTNWRCLNLAKPWFPDGKNDSKDKHLPSGVPWEEPVLVPFPIQDEGGMRRALITYNNAPLSSLNPAARLGSAATTLGDTIRSLVLYRPAYPGTDDWAKLPRLVYGHEYAFFVARIRNCGALPAQLASAGNPAVLKEANANHIFDAGFLPAVYKPEARYLRRVPIGALRVAPHQANRASHPNMRLQWGEDTRYVQPRAAEQPPVTGLSSRLARAKNDEANMPLLSDSNGSLPLMLIHERPYAFDVSRPTVDINTWDRSLSSSAIGADLRKQVWATVHRNFARDSVAAGDEALMLEDPAVSPYLLVELVAESGNAVTKPLLAKWNVNSRPGKLADLATSAIHVTVNPDSSTNVKITNDQVDVTIDSGTIAYLYLSPLVQKSTLARFFPQIVVGQSLEGIEIPNFPAGETQSEFVVLPPFALIVERTSTELPKPELLRGKLAAEYSNGRLRVSLSRTGENGFRNIGRVEILRQRWHWNGRPFWGKDGNTLPFPYDAFDLTTGIPVSKPSETLDRLSLWLLQEFATRKDFEVLSARLAEFTRDKVRSTRFERSDDLAAEPQATVYRFAARVFNRYAALLNPVASPAGSISQDSASTSLADIDSWKTIFVPCRWTGEIPIPHIKLILPLTESANGDSQANGVSGLLVVLEGPWFTVGGVTEFLKCEIASVEVPNSQDKIQQFGPDPIRTAAVGAATYKTRDLIGPVGHTFDESDAAPQFVNTSFLVPGASPGPDMSWFFGKIHFSRAVQFDKEVKSSRVTDDYWVQFLPRFVFQAGTDDITENCNVMLSDDKRMVSLRNGDKNLIIQPTADQQVVMHLYGILTAVIQDVSGRRAQEHFVAFFRFEGSKWITDEPPASAPDQINLRFRILEVEMPTNHGTPPLTLGDLWDALFPRLENMDSQARIVRVSRPIASAVQ